MTQISRAGFESKPCEISKFKNKYKGQNYFKIESFLSEDLLNKIKMESSSLEFTEKFHPGIGREFGIKDSKVFDELNFLLNSPNLYSWLEEITGEPQIQRLDGRVYYMSPMIGHFDSWHDDMSSNRKIAMSINLSPCCYEGGQLEIKQKQSYEALKISNSGFGDAIFFRLNENYHHRILPVIGNHPKIAYAGWYQSSPNYWSLLREGMKDEFHKPVV